MVASAVNNKYCEFHPLCPNKASSQQNSNRPLLIIFLNVFCFLRLVLKTHSGLQQHEDRPSQGLFFLLLCKWAKRHFRADFGRKLVAHLNSAHVAKTNLNNVREVGAGSQSKSMRVRRDKQPSAGD